MNLYKFAADVLRPGQSEVAIFTDGRVFEHKGNRTGWTGWWVIRKGCDVDRVIIYHRLDNQSDNEIWVGDFDRLENRSEDTRVLVRLKNLECVGKSAMDWRTFGDTHSNPIRYLCKPR